MSQEEEKKNQKKVVKSWRESQHCALVGKTWKITKESGQKKRYVLWLGVDGGTIRNKTEGQCKNSNTHTQ